MIVAFLFCGTRTTVADPPGVLPEVKLEEAASAKALDKAEQYVYILNVNDRGEIIFPPGARPVDGNRKEIETSGNLWHLRDIFAREHKRAVGPGNEDKPRRTLIILRIHKECPFKYTYAIMKTCRGAGFTKLQWRALIPNTGEGQIPNTIAGPGEKPDVEFVAQATANEVGVIEKITLRGEGIAEDGLDFPAVEAFAKKLKELVAKHKGKRLAIRLEIGAKVMHAYVIQLIDAAVLAGFVDVSPVPIDKKDR